jgi:hypothetical protein
LEGPSVKKLALLLCALAAASAQAAPIDSPADLALAGGSVIDFQSVAAGAYSNLELPGVSFSTGAGTQLYVDSAYAGNYNTSGQSLKNTYNGNAFGTLTLTFTAPTQAFAFNWGAADTLWSLTAYDASNNVLDTRLLNATKASNAGEFYGLSANTNIAYAVLSGNSHDYVFIDNLSVAAAVPEPETYILLGAGLLVIGLAVRRRQQA